MGRRLTYRVFDSVDKKAVRAMWRMWCEFERVRVAMQTLHRRMLDQGPLPRPVPPVNGSAVAPGVPDGAVALVLDHYYQARGGRWARVDLLRDEGLFGDAWLYGGIPYSLHERFVYVTPKGPLPTDMRRAVADAADGRRTAVAIVRGGKTHVGGWALY